MSLEASMVARVITADAALTASNVIWGDFGARAPAFPRVRLWRRPGDNVTIANALAVCNVDGIVQVDIYAEDADASPAQDQVISLATAIKTTLNAFVDEANKIKAVMLEDEFDQPSDRSGSAGDELTAHRILLLRVMATE